MLQTEIGIKNRGAGQFSLHFYSGFVRLFNITAIIGFFIAFAGNCVGLGGPRLRLINI
jgi:hypothetical protein